MGFSVFIVYKKLYKHNVSGVENKEHIFLLSFLSNEILT